MEYDNRLQSLFLFLAYSLRKAEDGFNALPGSAVLGRYIRSSHQNDPWRTLLEVLLVIFAVRTLLHSRTKGDGSGKHFIKFSEKEVDELVGEWTPEPLVQPLDADAVLALENAPVVIGAPGPRPKIASTGKNVINLASFNFAGLSGNEEAKVRAIEVLRNCGLGSCGPPGFYGTSDIHLQLERDIADFLGTEASIIYSQGFATISSVIPAFCKRGDIIIADRGVNFAIHQGLRLSRSHIRWYDHNDMDSLEAVMVSTAKEVKKKRWPLTRRFIITEGLFENHGTISDLPRLVELKNKYKYRLMLDESFSVGTLGRTGRGLTELYNVPASQVDMIVGSMANSFCGSGGFCAGNDVAINHQRINGTSFVFSAAMPPLLAAAASVGINVLTHTPSLLSDLHSNIAILRAMLEKLEEAELIKLVSHPASAVIHFNLRYPPLLPDVAAPPVPPKSGGNNPTVLVTKDAPHLFYDFASEDKILQEIVDEAVHGSHDSMGVLLTRATRLRGQEFLEPRPSIRISASAAFTRKETEKAAAVTRAAIVKVLGG